MTPEKFYNTLAEDYDAMTGFANRALKEEPFYRSFVEQYNIKTALDAGCGTGFHSLLLAGMGVEVTAVDVSRAMLAKTEDHAKEMHLAVKTIESDFLHLSEQVKQQFDSVLCLGNSLAHVMTIDDLLKAFQNFRSCVTSNGALILQVLNYHRILSKKERIVSIKESGSSTFIRFYDFYPGNLVFNILKIRRNNGALVHELSSTRLNPLTRQEIVQSLSTAHFHHIECFGNVALEKFDEDTSTDLIIIARPR